MRNSEMTDEQIIAQIERARAKQMKTPTEWGRLVDHAKELAGRHNIPTNGRWKDLRDKLIGAGLIAKYVKYTH